MVLRPHQHNIGYMGDGFYRSKDPTNIDGDHEICFIRPTRSRQNKLHIYVNKSLQE